MKNSLTKISPTLVGARASLKLSMWVPSLALVLAFVSLSGAARAQTAAAAPQATPPPPAAPRSVTVPKPVERTLRNGLRVIVVEHHATPLVAAQLLVKNGGEVDPANLSGLADMTAELLTKGTKTRAAPQIAQEIEALGGELTSGAGWDASRATVNVLSAKAEPAMAILADVVRNPVFQDEEIERLRQQYTDSISVDMNNPGTLASWVASRVVFGDNPYGHPVSGTAESVERIKREDVVALHSRYYRPDNAVLVIGGDIKAEDAFKLAEKSFGDWAKPAAALPVLSSNTSAQPARSAAVAGAGTPSKSKEEQKKETEIVFGKDWATNTQRIVVVDMPGAGQAAVVFARRGIARTDPEYFSGIVANSVLSGYSGRLNQEIRIKRGLSYGARSSLDVRREAGPFVASAQTKNQSGAEVASLLVGELTRLSSEPVGDTELTPRKAVLIGGFGRTLETTEGIVAQIASLALYGLDLGEINNYIGGVQAVTSAQIQKFAGSRLGVADSNIIIVGDAKDFIEPLRKQFPNVEVIKREDLDLNTGSLHKPAQGATK